MVQHALIGLRDAVCQLQRIVCQCDRWAGVCRLWLLSSARHSLLQHPQQQAGGAVDVLQHHFS